MVGSGFSKTVDYCYGVMVVGTMLLEERAKYIEEEVLQNEDEITHHRFSAKHGHVTWEGPRYSSEIKLEFQKEWISIMEQLGKYAGIANNAALIRVKAEVLAKGGGDGQNGGSGKRQKRLKAKKNPKHKSHQPAVDGKVELVS